MGGPIEEARSFYTNNLGMDPQEADVVLGQALNTYSQNMQPQNMMQMASNGGRIGYGLGDLVRGSGIARPVSSSESSGGSGSGLGGMIGRLIQQNPQLFRPVNNQQRLMTSSSIKNFIDENQNGIDDREEVAYGGRIGYQMGGLSTMPMDTGAPLQVPQQQQPSFSSAQSITMNPLLNYGQPQLGSGTPLMMQNGGTARLGYQTGGVTLPSQGSEMSQMQGMDQEQALQTIIQILIENGIPPEQAQQLALQLLQIFLEGGEPAIESFGNQLEQEEQTQMMAGGGIAGIYPRQGYFLGKLVKSVGKGISGAVKGIGKAVKSVVKSDIGKAALAAAAIYYTGGGAAFGGPGFGSAGTLFGGTTGLFGTAPLAGTLGPPSAGFLGVGGSFAPFSGTLASGIGSLVKGATGGNFLTSLAGGALGGALGGLLAPKQENETDEDYEARRGRVGPYLREYYTNLNPNATPEQVDQFVRLNTTEYGGAADTFAQGGIARLKYAGAGTVSSMVPPARQIEGGIIELDARKTGGYIPYGKKERVDDVPAMLAKDEFVFTSRAVKAAGGGSAQRGAEKMYSLMKQLESKGARA
jgi:hypothetical protein